MDDAGAMLVAAGQLRGKYAQLLVVVIAQGCEPGELELVVHGCGSRGIAVR